MKRRPAGSGTVYRPTPRQKVWWIAYRQGGRTVRESSGTQSKKAAEELLRKRLAARDAGAAPPPAEILTVEGLGKMVVADMIANGRRSVKRVELAIRALHASLGKGTAARDVDEARITEYVAERLATKAARATVNRELAALRRGFRLAERSRRLARVPHVALLHEDNARRGFFELEQLQAVLAHLPPDLQPVVEAAYETGWRVHSELLTRQWRHVDLKAGWLRLEPGEGKSGRGRMFPFTAALRRVLKAQRALTDTLEREQGRVIPWVFHRSGVPIRTFRRAWLTACAAAGLPGKIPHDFRRTAVRNLERAGVPRSAAKAMVGHLTDSIYQRYAIVDEGMLTEAGKKLGRLRR